MMKKPITFTLTLLFLAVVAHADIRLPDIFSSHMVLQQQSTVTLWGWAGPRENIKITASWDDQVHSLTAEYDASWTMQIETPRAGGPYTITLEGRNTIVLEDIMIGEVWVCSGQSNMGWTMSRTLPKDTAERQHFYNANIRLFNVPHTRADYPQDNVDGEWEVCSAESLEQFSSVGYFFGKKLEAEMNVPIGLINSSWGGTPAESWTPAALLHGDEALSEAANKKINLPGAPKTPGSLYNAMIHPIVPFAMAGVIWYQGESNVPTPDTYDKLMTAMIGGWRKAWNKEFPFYYVQIAPYEYEKNGLGVQGALLREQQAKTLALPNTGMVVISDLVDNVKDIHPTNKHDVGLRLAKLALSETYGHNIAGSKSPMFKRMEVKGNKVSLFFDNAPNGFKVIGSKEATEFFIAGDDKLFLPADVKIESDRIIVSNAKIKKPVAVRFSFSNAAISNVFSKEGLPVAPFRTDEWEVRAHGERVGDR